MSLLHLYILCVLSQVPWSQVTLTAGRRRSHGCVAVFGAGAGAGGGGDSLAAAAAASDATLLRGARSVEKGASIGRKQGVSADTEQGVSVYLEGTLGDTRIHIETCPEPGIIQDGFRPHASSLMWRVIKGCRDAMEPQRFC